ncbi:hypothetical protein Tco_0836028 [Tanacetum coccineum]
MTTQLQLPQLTVKCSNNINGAGSRISPTNACNRTILHNGGSRFYDTLIPRPNMVMLTEGAFTVGSEEDSDTEQVSEGLNDMQKNLALIAKGNKMLVGARENCRWAPVVQQLGYSALTARICVIMLRNAVKPNLLETPHRDEDIDEQRSWKRHTVTWQRLSRILIETQGHDVSHMEQLSAQTDFVSKEIYTELLQRFARLEKHSISLEIALQECQVRLKNDTVCKEKASNVFRKEREQYVEIQDLKAQLQDKNIAISELKKLVAKCKGKSVDTKFDKPSVVRQPNAQRLPKPSVLGKPATFSNSLERQYFAKKKSVLKTNESESLSKPVTLQNLPKTAMKAVRNTNVIKPGMYRIASSTTQTRAPQLNQTFRNTNPCASTSTGVAHKTNVSRPQPRSNQMKDKVVQYTSHAKLKKTEVEEHPRISSISNKTKSVTACNDSLNSRT